MREDESDDETTYRVVVNSERWYAIRPAGQECAPGWEDAGVVGTRAECLAHMFACLRGAAASGRAAEAGEGPESFVVNTIRVGE